VQGSSGTADEAEGWEGGVWRFLRGGCRGWVCRIWDWVGRLGLGGIWGGL